MAELAQARSELRGLVETLEQRVEDRTRELRETQDELVLAEKLASLGRLSASIARQIEDPLAGILTFARLIGRRLPGRDRDRSTTGRGAGGDGRERGPGAPGNEHA